MSVDWKSIECALIEWVFAKIPNLEEEQVIWDDQNISQPAYPFISLKRDTVIRIGARDEQRTETDLSQPQGQEIALISTGTREFTLTVNARVDELNGANDPNCDAMALVTLLQISLSQQSIQEAFCLAGLVVVEELAVIDLSQVVNGGFISRASMDVRFRTTFTCTEQTGFIDAVGIKSVPCDPPGLDDVSGVDLEVTC